MTTVKTISNKRGTALIFRHGDERLFVKWFDNESRNELENWPESWMPSRAWFETLLEKVRAYADKNNFTLWSY